MAVYCGHEEIVRYICTHRASVASISNNDNRLPLHLAMFNDGASMSMVQLVYKAYPQAISVGDVKGRLPIHYLFDQGPILYRFNRSAFHVETDLNTAKLRFILSKCPDCVSIPDSPTWQAHQTAYDFSLDHPTFVQRLMLNAKPDMNIQRYRELNYTARRMGMFLGFSECRNCKWIERFF